ncbi:hypothetical protein NM208_g3391 [Fusarium decemcellulare]|uniref:Uncharacterized protein n=1 Tax=Fusarium decemcellulare TaxID=57161 RepID=A0ACC1SP58_9HYPO|nr:hypothetical protein NM208_g3391 [Fusarium decemcellulare]
MKLLPHPVLFLAGLLASFAGADEVSCIEQPSENLLANPSWELGLAGWSYSYSGSGLSSEHTDGAQSVYIPGTVILGQIFQTVLISQVGATYTASVDFMPFMDPSTTLQKTCLVYLIHDDALTSNIIDYKTMVVNRNTNHWNSLSGTYAPTKSTMVFRLISNCGTPATPLFRMHFDNASFRAPPIQVCTTSLSPTSTTESQTTTTAEPTTTTTTTESQSTTESETTTSASETTTESQTTATADLTTTSDSTTITTEAQTSTSASETTTESQTTTSAEAETSTSASETTTESQTTTTTESQSTTETQSATSQTLSISEAPTTTSFSTTFATSTRTRGRCRP